ncbi:MAG: LemA family protein [Candidatus Brocadiaceae bacterium]|nr:LemA family protein [Candidatus Brocadiaceae bacterium]
MWIWIIAAVVLLPGLVFVLLYNGLVFKRNRVESAFSTIDVLLKKRYDLIPNLVATVKGYATHEKEVFSEITRLRAEAIKESGHTDRSVELNNRISELLFGIMAVVEAYPELKANENFLHLQRSLNEVEEQISAARRAFNAAVMDLNNAVQMFPSSVVAGMTGFGPRRFFEATGVERAVPSVAGPDGGEP